MNLYDELQGDISALLIDLGVGTLTRTVVTGGSRNKAGARSTSTQTLDAFAIVGAETITDEQGRLVSVTMATMLTQPLENDKLVMGLDTYVVGKVTKIAPQGQALVWKAVVTS